MDTFRNMRNDKLAKAMINKLAARNMEGFYVQTKEEAKSHISSVSVKALALSVTRWIQRTSMHLTQHLTQVLLAWRNAGSRR